MRKKIIIGSVLVLIAIVIGSTFAWFTWTTSNEQNTNVVVTVGGASISYEDGENITNNNLIPTSTKEKGISKQITMSSTSLVYLNLDMTIVSLDTGLKDESFKYGLYDNEGTPVVEGNFASSNQDDVINLLKNVEVSSAEQTYILYIWIDGNMPNPSTMYNQNFEFRLNASATDEIPPISGVELGNQIKAMSNGAKNSVTAVATTDEGVWETTDDYGTTYYFRGAVDNNYVEFAGYYFRIVRINGDGSIRLIYDGTSAHANGESSTDRQIGTSAYNSNYNDNAYIGYMYGSTGASSYSATHANTNNSTIKTSVDNWYKTNIEDKGYSDKVADVVYCNDRQIAADSSSYSGYGSLGYGTNKTVYAPSSRLYTTGWSWESTQEIKMTCSQKNDAFTVDDVEKGNGALTYPVGLLTVDEALAGGGKGGTINRNYYLYTGQTYWTMSPYLFGGSYANGFSVHSNGVISDGTVGSAYGVRPVLSLKSSVMLSGSGTLNDPWKVN